MNMKRFLLLALMLVLSLVYINSYGQNIILVTDDAAAGQLYADELTAAGYTVEIRTDLNVSLSEEQIAALNAADLVIITRNTNSANYNFPDIWNSIEAPILLQSCFLARNNRLLWLNSPTQIENDGIELTVSDSIHPIFEGIDVSTGLLAINAAVPLHTLAVPDAGNGTVIAVSSKTGNVVIAEWPKDTEFYEGSGQFATGFRAIFFTGLSFDFTDAGKTLYLNMVKYVLDPDVVVSVKKELKKEIKIYPLPVEDILKIEGDVLPNSKFEIVTLSGQVLISSNLSDSYQINTSDLKSGLYVLKISSKEKTITQKIVKK
jgi:hypothetical protein